MNSQECRIRPEMININSNELTFYPYSIEVNKCGDSCSNIDDPYMLNYVLLMLLKTEMLKYSKSNVKN